MPVGVGWLDASHEIAQRSAIRGVTNVETARTPALKALNQASRKNLRGWPNRCEVIPEQYDGNKEQYAKQKAVSILRLGFMDAQTRFQRRSSVVLDVVPISICNLKCLSDLDLGLSSLAMSLARAIVRMIPGEIRTPADTADRQPTATTRLMRSAG